MVADNLVTLPGADGQLIGAGLSSGYIANISVKTAGSTQLNIYDGTSNTGKHIASVPTGTVGVVQVERKFHVGVYVENATGWVGSLGLG